MTNIEFYLNNAEDCYYKNEETFLNNPNGICYIGECGLDDLYGLSEQGKDLTDEEIISERIGVSKNAILEEIEDWFGEDLEDFLAEKECTIDELALVVLQNVEWQYVQTYLQDQDL